MRNMERVVVWLMLCSLVVAWVVGAQREAGDLTPVIAAALPRAEGFSESAPGLYAGSTAEGGLAGYVALGQSTGYGGPLRLALGTGKHGRIERVIVYSHKESVPFFKRTQRLPGALIGKACSEPATLGTGIDAVSGATLSSNAILHAARAAAGTIAVTALQLPPPPQEKPAIVFGAAEMLLLSLILAAQASFLKGLKYKAQLRWATMLSGLFVIGFLYVTPVTLANVNSLLLGYWPHWRDRLLWYLVFAAVFLPILFKGRNTYCTHLCPFGAAQECVGLIGGARIRPLPAGLRVLARWLPRVLAWGFIMVALLERNPGMPSHEVFGVMFERTGTSLQAALLAVILLTALFVKRPWCHYLCAIRPMADVVLAGRNRLLSLVTKKNGTPLESPEQSS